MKQIEQKLLFPETDNRYSHLAGLTEEEKQMVMFLADCVVEQIKRSKEKGKF